MHDRHLQATFQQLLVGLAHRLERFSIRQRLTAHEACHLLSFSRADYFAYKKGKPRNSKGWSLLELIRFARQEGCRVSELFSEIEGFKETSQTRSKTDEELLLRFQSVPLPIRRKLCEVLEGRMASTQQTKAEWFAVLAIDLFEHGDEKDWLHWEQALLMKTLPVLADGAEKDKKRARLMSLLKWSLQPQRAGKK
jgi:hypothetical protein